MKKLKLLKESGLSLSKCVDICRANQASAAQPIDTAPSQTEQEASAVIQRESPKKPKAPKENGKDSKDQLSAECKYCDNKHERKRDKCAACGKTCSSCGKANYFVAKCSKNTRESRKKRSQKFKRKKVNQFDDNTESSYSSEEEILSVSLEHTANAVDM